jgi:hypothetical protein
MHSSFVCSVCWCAFFLYLLMLLYVVWWDSSLGLSTLLQMKLRKLVFKVESAQCVSE